MSKRTFFFGTGTLLLVALLAMLLSAYAFPPRYIVESLVRVAYAEPLILRENDSPSAQEDYVHFVAAQCALVKSRSVLTRALMPQNIAELSIVRSQADVLTWLNKDLHVEPVPNAQLIRISMTSKVPQEAEKLINSIVATYMEEVVMRGRRERLEKLELTRNKAGEFRERLRLRRRTLRDLEAAVSDSVSAGLRRDFLREEATELSRQRTRARLDLIKSRAKLFALEAGAKKKPTPEAENGIAMLMKDISVQEGVLKALGEEVARAVGELAAAESKVRASGTDHEGLDDSLERIVRRLNDELAVQEVNAIAPARVSVWEGASSRLE
jgi:hypothetical protein